MNTQEDLHGRVEALLNLAGIGLSIAHEGKLPTHGQITLIHAPTKRHITCRYENLHTYEQWLAMVQEIIVDRGPR